MKPALVRDGDALYLDDVAGVRWRVWWVCYGPPLAKPGRKRALRVGDRRANYLYFVRADGFTKLRRFERGDDWTPDAATLAEWIRLAWCPATPGLTVEPWSPRYARTAKARAAEARGGDA
ncbi:hypothetical protein tb265_39180 [Gemmatimonadetes bacterium T265]|nr:hypothetical protein tb265_39180 [Gemmatimonadetes bacterium T265]